MKSDILYRIAGILISLFMAFLIGWYSASRYTLTTMKAWYEPSVNEILIQDYMGNIEGHYFTSEVQYVGE